MVDDKALQKNLSDKRLGLASTASQVDAYLEAFEQQKKQQALQDECKQQKTGHD